MIKIKVQQIAVKKAIQECERFAILDGASSLNWANHPSTSPLTARGENEVSNTTINVFLRATV